MRRGNSYQLKKFYFGVHLGPKERRVMMHPGEDGRYMAIDIEASTPEGLGANHKWFLLPCLQSQG